MTFYSALNVSNYTKYGNWQFWYTKKSQKKSPSRIYIPSEKEISHLDQIKITDQTSLYIDDDNWNPEAYHWLEHVYKLSYTTHDSSHKTQDKPIYILDNHNHALFYRVTYISQHQKEYETQHMTHNNFITLLHLDQHSDLVENTNQDELKHIYTTYIQDISSLKNVSAPSQTWSAHSNIDNPTVVKMQQRHDTYIQDIYTYTHEKCHMWNFIKPFLHIYPETDFTRIKSEYQLLHSLPDTSHSPNSPESPDSSNITIIDIDLDFWAPEMSIDNYEQTIIHTRRLIDQADLVTIATSPYYIDQQLAPQVLRDLLA